VSTAFGGTGAVFDPFRAIRGNAIMLDEETLTEKAKSDLLYLEQLNSYAENTKNTPEYIRAMAMYTHALHVIDQRYGELEPLIYRTK
jgi:4-alpha-glucanotransferase